jgi:hypothetical protein
MGIIYGWSLPTGRRPPRFRYSGIHGNSVPRYTGFIWPGEYGSLWNTGMPTIFISAMIWNRSCHHRSVGTSGSTEGSAVQKAQDKKVILHWRIMAYVIAGPDLVSQYPCLLTARSDAYKQAAHLER